ncbi:MAG: hypothetical protein M3071_06080, partial [Actinomycetota bacterium]|nr:hypothetical protein [Actinomycetota bacterium]
RVFTQYNGPFPVQVEIDVPSNYDEIAAYEAQMAQAQTWKETHIQIPESGFTQTPDGTWVAEGKNVNGLDTTT